MIDVILSQRRSPFMLEFRPGGGPRNAMLGTCSSVRPNHPGARRREGSFGEAMYLFDGITVNFPIYGI